jgi:NSS family neurotransmitter:Na+ symporter
MTENAAGPATWSSRFVFYLGVVGAAVGLGSIWRFPYLAGTSGGSAFILVFVLAIGLIATPLLAAEFLIGRRARSSPPTAAGEVARQSGLGARSRRWNAIGLLGTTAAFLILSYYAVVAGWVLAYTWKCASGALSGLPRAEVTTLWRRFLSSPVEMGAWHLAFVALVAYFSARGLHRGIELATKIRGPALLGLLLVLDVYALASGESRRGLAFAFAPNFRAITPEVVLVAIGQAFYATGVGMAMMLAYGAYVSRGTSLVRSAAIISGSILLVSLLSTLLVFPLVFHYGMNPAQGPELVFDVLPKAFAEMPAGRLVGSFFFLLLVFAALTPSIAALEPTVAHVLQRTRLRRGPAVLLSAGAVWLLGLASVFSFNLWAHWRPLSFLPGFGQRTWFDTADYVASNLLLPLGAVLTSILVGWRLDRAAVAEELAETTPFARRACVFLLRTVCPVAIVVVLIAKLLG